jgi:DNA modification methylase
MAKHPNAATPAPRLCWDGRAPAGAWLQGAPADLQRLEDHPPRLPPLLASPAIRGRLVLGDNLAVGRALLPTLRGAVDLIYIDPPFGTGGSFRARHQPGAEARLAYGDAWAGGMRGYLDMLTPRLELAHALLAPRGSLYVHLDQTAAHYVKVVLDEIFGSDCFQREIIWRIGWVSGYKGKVQNWVRNHDTILFYTREPAGFTFNKMYVPHPPGYSRRGGGEGPGHPVDDVWNGSPAEHVLSGKDSLDSIQIKSFAAEKTGYETQKNESLLRRIISASSDPGQLVVDLFAGAGTTAVVAEALGRQWLVCDISPMAVHIARKRLLALPSHRGFTVLAEDGGQPASAAAEQLPTVTVAPDGSVTLALRQPEETDYWAVQWEGASWQGPLRADWVSCRRYGLGQSPSVEASVTHRYPQKGRHAIAVHVGDADGRLCRGCLEVSTS